MATKYLNRGWTFARITKLFTELAISNQGQPLDSDEKTLLKVSNRVRALYPDDRLDERTTVEEFNCLIKAYNEFLGPARERWVWEIVNSGLFAFTTAQGKQAAKRARIYADILGETEAPTPAPTPAPIPPVVVAQKPAEEQPATQAVGLPKEAQGEIAELASSLASLQGLEGFLHIRKGLRMLLGIEEQERQFQEIHSQLAEATKVSAAMTKDILETTPTMIRKVLKEGFDEQWEKINETTNQVTRLNGLIKEVDRSVAGLINDRGAKEKAPAALDEGTIRGIVASEIERIFGPTEQTPKDPVQEAPVVPPMPAVKHKKKEVPPTPQEMVAKRREELEQTFKFFANGGTGPIPPRLAYSAEELADVSFTKKTADGRPPVMFPMRMYFIGFKSVQFNTIKGQLKDLPLEIEGSWEMSGDDYRRANRADFVVVSRFNRHAVGEQLSVPFYFIGKGNVGTAVAEAHKAYITFALDSLVAEGFIKKDAA